MVKTRELSESERRIIVGQYRAGVKQRDIAVNMHCSQSTVSRTISKFRNHQTLKNLPKSGRPKVTTPREDRSMVRYALRQRFSTGNESLFSD